ncbi:YafY family protein [Paenibacillus lupini]|uniref:helix-turn-helix transcriptional regulator n=1 Tax=Paenibacillus lupini TaxID=1450204 RepID=UPI0014228DFB|nr:YafY family protein [Paenibacillus lupini]NIK23236.1 putative DNA-binding transcriptional regulator YafY [Paenibacillus lupini]
MGKSRRLIELMMAVNRKRKFTVKELAEEFGVSARTMLRDLQELSGMGVPLYSQVGAGGGYQVLAERSLPPISFTENEAFSIFFASHALRHFSSLPFKASAESALRKFYRYLSEDVKRQIDEMRHRVDFFTQTRQERADYLEILLQASIRRLPVTINYGIRENEINQRTIQPIGIYAHEGYWFCPAYCYLRKAYRLFRADRIRSAVLADAEALTTTVDVSEVDLTNWGHHFYTKEESVDVKVKLTAKGIELFRDKCWIFPWGEVHSSDNGTGILEMGIFPSEILFFAEYFFSFGAEAVVLQPEELREAIRRKLVRTLEKYNVPK